MLTMGSWGADEVKGSTNLIPFRNDLLFPPITINDESRKTMLPGVTAGSVKG